jgi:N-acetyl-1-D-myo-inositol-2-amino-2-deoxy-alpha-D-glucopyranoside deacetylase
MKELGISDHRFLGGFGRYSDSGMAWHEDGHAIAGDDRPDDAFWDADLAAEIEATAYADQKVAALHAHRTQIEVDGPFFALSNHVGNEVLGIESFRIAKGVTSPGPDGVETDLFAGI